MKGQRAPAALILALFLGCFAVPMTGRIAADEPTAARLESLLKRDEELDRQNQNQTRRRVEAQSPESVRDELVEQVKRLLARLVTIEVEPATSPAVPAYQPVGDVDAGLDEMVTKAVDEDLERGW